MAPESARKPLTREQTAAKRLQHHLVFDALGAGRDVQPIEELAASRVAERIDLSW